MTPASLDAVPEAPRIIRLTSEVIDRIAAGEVIERPASVVKELLENAIDAGATLVDIEVEGGGLERITVSDDGEGMGVQDARLALERHATSKLRDADDLFAIRTLGFRGEALSSIAAVSKLTLTTRRPRDPSGHRLRLDGGRPAGEEGYGCPPGTAIDVRELFFNTPARRKFLRSATTEQAHVVEACTRVGLGHDACGIVLRVGDRRLLDVPAAAASLESQGARILALLRHRVRGVTPFSHRAADPEGGVILVEGFLGPLEAVRKDGRTLWTLVNGRAVRDRTVQRAVLDAYGPALPRGAYPVGVVRLTVDPRSVDVNVHPQKLEVRFADSRTVYRAVAAAVSRAVTGQLQPGPQRTLYAGGAPAPLWVAEGTATSFPSAPGLATATLFAPPAHWGEPSPREWSAAEIAAATSREWPQPASAPAGPTVLRLGGCALVWAAGGPAWVVDLRRLAARLCHEALRRELQGGAVLPRGLLLPEVLSPPAADAAWLEAGGADDLERHGFELVAVGPSRWALRAVPAALGAAGEAAAALQQLCLDVIGVLNNGGAVEDTCARWAGDHGDLQAAVAAARGGAGLGVGLDGAPLAVEIDEAGLRRLLTGV